MIRDCLLLEEEELLADVVAYTFSILAVLALGVSIKLALLTSRCTNRLCWWPIRIRWTRAGTYHWRNSIGTRSNRYSICTAICTLCDMNTWVILVKCHISTSHAGILKYIGVFSSIGDRPVACSTIGPNELSQLNSDNCTPESEIHRSRNIFEAARNGIKTTSSANPSGEKWEHGVNKGGVGNSAYFQSWRWLVLHRQER